eukprot:1215847-Prymnesium_polylepis.1
MCASNIHCARGGSVRDVCIQQQRKGCVHPTSIVRVAAAYLALNSTTSWREAPSHAAAADS